MYSIRSKLLGAGHPSGEGITCGHENREVEIIGSHLRSLLTTPEEKSLGDRVNTHAQLYWIVPDYYLILCDGCHYYKFSPTLAIVRLFNFCQPGGYETRTCISLVTNEVEHSFICLFITQMCSSVQGYSYLSISILDFNLFLIDSKEPICLVINPESTLCVMSIFLQFLASVFPLLIT